MGWSCREEWDMEIRRLEQKDYAGRKFTARYQTKGYYEICASEQGFRLDYRLFPAPVVRSFDDVFFGNGWRPRRLSAHLPRVRSIGPDRRERN